MFIERATSKRLSSLQRSETYAGPNVPLPETLRSARARAIEFVALSINISLLLERKQIPLLHLEVEFTYFNSTTSPLAV